MWLGERMLEQEEQQHKQGQQLRQEQAALQAQGADHDVDQEQEQLRLALEASMAEQRRQQQRGQEKEEEQLQAALRASLHESSRGPWLQRLLRHGPGAASGGVPEPGTYLQASSAPQVSSQTVLPAGVWRAKPCVAGRKMLAVEPCK